jgi:purine-cytosine permease-like protein
MALASVTALIVTMGLNAYSGMLTVVTGLNSLFETPPSPRLRIAAIAAVAIAWIGATFAITGNAIALLFATLTIMLYLLVPWTAVNLVDYFFVRRGRYAITHLFDAAGIYGAWGGRGLLAYGLGFAATLPFFVLPDVYTGPAARALGGIDIGWLVGLLVAGGSYLLLTRSMEVELEAAAIRSSEAELRDRYPAP